MSATTATTIAMPVTSIVTKQFENAALAVSKQHIEVLAKHYGFDFNEALALLPEVQVEVKKMERKSKAAASSDATDSSTSSKEKVKAIPLPWMGLVNPGCCQGIVFNYGLFNQCQKKKVADSLYCTACKKDADAESTGVPKCGNVNARMAVGWQEYKDSKGRSPTDYNKVLHKLKTTLDAAIEYAATQGRIIPECYTAAGEYVAPVKGGKAVVATADGEASIASSTNKGKKLTPEEKEKRAADRKAASEAKAAAEADKKKYTATAKSFADIGKTLEEIMAEGVPQDIAELAIKKHQDMLAKKAEIAAKRALDKATKKAEPKAAKAVEAQAVASVVQTQTVAAASAVPEVATKVMRITINGTVVKKGTPGGDYLRDSNNVVYSAATSEPIGNWDVTSNKIIFNAPSEEVEEEEYETI